MCVYCSIISRQPSVHDCKVDQYSNKPLKEMPVFVVNPCYHLKAASKQIHILSPVYDHLCI